VRAIAADQYRPTTAADCFRELELPTPEPGPQDLRVRVKAVSVNPVDCKVRASLQPAGPRILGWDAAGIVEQVGAQVSLFRPGDEVYYAGSLERPGSNSQQQLVDQRIVGRKPANLSFEQAAALPLTALTAWEALFERLAIAKVRSPAAAAPTLLIINGAGGVGSIAIQLAKQVAGLRVIATASRPETTTWVQQMGADHCINHHQPLATALTQLGFESVDYIFCCSDSDRHWPAITEVIRPQGKICLIVENKQPLAMQQLKTKSASLVWEFMFTRSRYQTPDLQVQHELLNQVADLVDQGVLKTTLTQTLGALSAERLAQAHGLLETGRTIGKLVLSELI
jgi:zinc-binding alcohol dehydrogenase family protein